jgi:hypothetical protein
MLRKFRAYFFATLMIVATSCSTSINVKHVSADSEKIKNEGVYYSLPKTVVTVEANISKIYKIKGPYADYASKLLGLTNVITENSSSYSLDNMKIDSYSIPDPDQYYFVEIPRSCHKRNSVLLQLSESGIITSINDLNKLNVKTNPSDTLEVQSDVITKPFNYAFVNSNQTATFDTIIQTINADTASFKKETIKKVYVEKTIEQKAKEAADYIMKIKENEFDLLIGYSEVNYSKESIEYMYGQLKKMETEYLNLFTGVTITHHFKYHSSYNPADPKNMINVPLFRLSSKEGITDTSNANGEIVYLKIDKLENSKTLESFNNAKQNAKRKQHGFYYRIPEYAKVSVFYEDKVKAESNIPVSQYGVVSELPSVKKMKALYYPNTGALKSVAVNKKAHHFWFH